MTSEPKSKPKTCPTCGGTLFAKTSSGVVCCGTCFRLLREDDRGRLVLAGRKRKGRKR